MPGTRGHALDQVALRAARAGEIDQRRLRDVLDLRRASCRTRTDRCSCRPARARRAAMRRRREGRGASRKDAARGPRQSVRQFRVRVSGLALLARISSRARRSFSATGRSRPGELPGPLRQAELDVELAILRLVGRQRDAHDADAVVGIEIELPHIAERRLDRRPQLPAGASSPSAAFGQPLRSSSASAAGVSSFSTNGSANAAVSPMATLALSSLMPESPA